MSSISVVCCFLEMMEKLGGFKTVSGTVLMVAGTWLVLEDLSLVQFELYRGGGQNLHPP